MKTQRWWPCQDLYLASGASQTLVECTGEDDPTLTASPIALARRHEASGTCYLLHKDQEGHYPRVSLQLATDEVQVAPPPQLHHLLQDDSETTACPQASFRFKATFRGLLSRGDQSKMFPSLNSTLTPLWGSEEVFLGKILP